MTAPCGNHAAVARCASCAPDEKALLIAALVAVHPLRGGKRDHSYCPFCLIRTDTVVDKMADLWSHEPDCPYIKARPYLPAPKGDWSPEEKREAAVENYEREAYE